MTAAFGVALDLDNPRCMAHPEQRLIVTRQFGGPDILTCPICNAEVLDAMRGKPGVISIKVGR